MRKGAYIPFAFSDTIETRFDIVSRLEGTGGDPATCRRRIVSSYSRDLHLPVSRVGADCSMKHDGRKLLMRLCRNDMAGDDMTLAIAERSGRLA